MQCLSSSLETHQNVARLEVASHWGDRGIVMYLKSGYVHLLPLGFLRKLSWQLETDCRRKGHSIAVQKDMQSSTEPLDVLPRPLGSWTTKSCPVNSVRTALFPAPERGCQWTSARAVEYRQQQPQHEI